MRAPQDPVIRDARRRMLRAAAHYERALEELRPALRALERHPDFRRTERRRKAGARSKEALTLAHWYHQCITSAIDDGEEDTARWLREDATGGAESSMQDYVETEERDLQRGAKRAAA